MLKKIVTLLALCASTSIFAANSGFYMGIDLGGSRTNATNNSGGIDLPGASVDKNSFAGGANIGYQIGKYLAAELGYMYLGQTKFNNILGVSGADAKVTQQSGDLLAKVLLPITHGLGAYALVGGAYVYEKPSVNGKAKSLGVTAGNSEHGIRLTYGLGASYDFNPSWTIDASWRQIDHGNNIPQTDLVLGGLTYHFG